MENLGKLFGSASRVRIIKFFLMNEEELLDKESLRKKTKVAPQVLTKELKLLENANFLKQKSTFITVKLKTKEKKKRVPGYCLNTQCSYLVPLKALLCGETSIDEKDIIKKINPAGKIKTIISAGLFVQDPEGRIDLLIAGDNINATRLRNAITTIESELGRELRYAVFDTADLKYRLSVCDRLVRDVLDYPHRVIVDKIGISK